MVVVLVVAVAGGALYLSRQTPLYRSTAGLGLQPDSAAASSTALRLVAGPRFARQLAAEVPFAVDRRTVTDLTTAAGPGGRVEVTATSPQPSFAMLAAAAAGRVLTADLRRDRVEVRLVSAASLPRAPFRPRPGVVLALSLLAGAVLSAAAVAGRQRRRRSPGGSPRAAGPPPVPSFSGR